MLLTWARDISMSSDAYSATLARISIGLLLDFSEPRLPALVDDVPISPFFACTIMYFSHVRVALYVYL